MAGHNQAAERRTDHKKRKPDEFRIVETVKDPDGVIAIITERVRDGRVSFSLAREFDSGGETKRTSYLSVRHLPAVQRLLSDLSEKLELYEDRARAKRR